MKFTIGGCVLQFHFSFFALLTFCSLFSAESGGATLFLCVLLHEAAHVVALCLFHAPPKHCTVSALGFALQPDPTHPLSDLQAAAVSLAGPLLNVLLFFLCLLLGVQHSTFAKNSLVLGVFHLLPIASLDGATALCSLLSVCFSAHRVQKISLCVSFLFLFPMAVLGFLVLLRSRYNFSLLALSLYFLFCLVLGQGPSLL